MSSAVINVDIAIIGGGITGLWILAAARARGYSAILVEKDGLGGQQTLASQGIIHGGTKYSLKGQLTGAAQALAAMPRAWRTALEGRADVDLSAAKILSPHQYLWTTRAVGGKVTSFFASKVMQNRMIRLQSSEFPSFLPQDFDGHCYALEEPVVDIASVLYCFLKQYEKEIFTDARWHRTKNELQLETPDSSLAFSPKTWIYTAGENNATLSGEKQQIRPLHMMACQVPLNMPPIYGHCLGMSDKPKVTITTHPTYITHTSAEQVYWIGGQVAETGVRRHHTDQICAVQQVLRETLPWLIDSTLLTPTRFTSVFINRAEGFTGGRRPDKPVIIAKENQLTIWPTKLAFAPFVAEQILPLLPSVRTPMPDIKPHAVRIAPYKWQETYVS